MDARFPSLGRASIRLILWQKWVCGFLVVAMALLITAEVVSREVFDHSLQVTHEIAGYLLVAVAFLSVGVSLHDRALFRVEFLFARLPARGQVALQLVFDLLALGFGLVLAYQLIRLVESSYSRGFKEATILATPLYLPQLVMPIGVGLMIVVLLAQVCQGIRILTRGEDIERPGEEPQ